MCITRKMLLIVSFIVLNLLLVATATASRAKKNAKLPFSLREIPENLPIAELQESLRVLSTDELKTLSQYIDKQNEGQMDSFCNKRESENDQNTKNLLGVMENYWTRHVKADKAKKRRNIEDLYDEMAHEIVEPPISKEDQDYINEMEALGCTCRNLPNEWALKNQPSELVLRNQPNEWVLKNQRTKRENRKAANLEKGYSIEEYVRDLENSFPRDQDDREQYEGETVRKNHLRIKRLND